MPSSKALFIMFEITGAICKEALFSNLAGIWSHPVAFFGLSVFRSVFSCRMMELEIFAFGVLFNLNNARVSCNINILILSNIFCNINIIIIHNR